MQLWSGSPSVKRSDESSRLTDGISVYTGRPRKLRHRSGRLTGEKEGKEKGPEQRHCTGREHPWNRPRRLENDAPENVKRCSKAAREHPDIPWLKRSCCFSSFGPAEDVGPGCCRRSQRDPCLASRHVLRPTPTFRERPRPLQLWPPSSTSPCRRNPRSVLPTARSAHGYATSLSVRGSATPPGAKADPRRGPIRLNLRNRGGRGRAPARGGRGCRRCGGGGWGGGGFS